MTTRTTSGTSHLPPPTRPDPESLLALCRNRHLETWKTVPFDALCLDQSRWPHIITPHPLIHLFCSAQRITLDDQPHQQTTTHPLLNPLLHPGSTHMPDLDPGPRRSSSSSSDRNRAAADNTLFLKKFGVLAVSPSLAGDFHEYRGRCGEVGV